MFDVLAICCWRKWTGILGITAASQGCTRVGRCECSSWWESYLARRATRSQVSAKGLRHVARLSEAEVNVDCIAEEENFFLHVLTDDGRSQIVSVCVVVFAKVSVVVGLWRRGWRRESLKFNLFPACSCFLTGDDLHRKTMNTVSGLSQVSCGSMDGSTDSRSSHCTVPMIFKSADEHQRGS